MNYSMKPIGVVRHESQTVPRHWSVSDVSGRLVINPEYTTGLKDIRPGDKITVLFVFHRAPEFDPSLLIQKPPHTGIETGVFSICSPVRPNPVGLSVLTVGRVEENVIFVTGLDMFDGTPIIDIKPSFPPPAK
ncbi:MAG: tRNA (N6-threonylcarbamoyladenosine(37)-N6)-methyltransferase TrmO [Deltaproteobacteria bacterium]|nr:tRNA (N6-threonylcarbamoyladenosine(37)-N6)-methyltransferase TrmO [Deltaproteobacteria bacterium]